MQNYEAIRFVLVYTLFLNLLVTAAKIIAGYVSGSLSILADGFDSLFDAVTNVIGLIAIYLSRRPPDEDHPYGHRRYEILMALVVSVLLFFTCYQILQGAYHRLSNPVPPEVNFWSFASLFFSIAVHGYTAQYELRRGKELKSEFLIADVSHTRADILVTVGVIVGLIVVNMGYPILDTIMAVAIAFLIAKIGIDIIRSSARILTDAAALEVAKVAAIVGEVPGVESYHHIRSRGQEDDVHLDLHIRVTPDMPVSQAHRIAHEVQRRLRGAIEGVRDVIVHIEPHRGATHVQQRDVFSRLRTVASDSDVTVHHLNAYEINGQYFVDLHLEVPERMTLREAHQQASLLEDQIKAKVLEVADISTHIEPATATRTACGERPEDSQITQRVREFAQSMPEVLSCQDVRVHKANDDVFVTMRCILDGHLLITQAHDVATRIEAGLSQEYPSIARVSVHVEPASPDTHSG